MGFLAKTRKLLSSLAGVDESYIDESDLTDKDIEKVIMIDPRAVELLKVLENRKKAANEVESSIVDNNKASLKGEKGLGKYRTSSKVPGKPNYESLDEMTDILEGKKGREREDD